MNREKKLQVRNLTISFRTVNGKLQAVRDISFDLYKGETLAIVGESGSGKSATSKTILGISAANTIIEGGEVLYDGKDLLKISEEDFHTIRGDKIAMVFQDPLSSLNPVMRIGRQLTEAMLLKNRSNRKECRKKLASGIQELDSAMKRAGCTGDAKRFDTFRKVISEQSRLEEPYDRAYESAHAAAKAADDLLLEIEKEMTKDAAADCRELREYCLAAVNRFVVHDGDTMKALVSHLNTHVRSAVKTGNFSVVSETLLAIRNILTEALAEERPDFFAYACYNVLDGGNIAEGSVAELNVRAKPSSHGQFMTAFHTAVRDAMAFTAEESRKNMILAVEELKKGERIFAEMPSEPEAKRIGQELADVVEKAIDPLETIRDSLAYTFRVSLSAGIRLYYRGIAGNAAEEKRFARQTEKYERAKARGKEPSGKVAPLALVDLDNAREDILHILVSMREQFESRLAGAGQTDMDQRAENYISWMRAAALGEIHRVTRQMAKDTAIRTMEQVGITEARKRFRQYPFEFSGGMRQRIVIAISLMADPDVLICDEPTTALDVTIQAQILELINRLKRERNLSVIFITHDLGVVANMADRVAVMYAGKIVEYGEAEEIFYHPAHPYTWALLASIPDLDSKGSRLEAIPGTPPNMIYPPVGDAFAARNKYALDIDFELQPPMFRITDTHYAATWLLHPDAPKVEMPEIVKDRIARMSGEGRTHA